MTDYVIRTSTFDYEGETYVWTRRIDTDARTAEVLTMNGWKRIENWEPVDVYTLPKANDELSS